VSVELFPGRYLSLSQTARLMPPSDRGPVAAATVWRWHRVGVRLPDGSRLKLRATRIGNRFVVSEEALREFINAQQGGADDDAAPTLRSPAQRRRAAEAAGRELERKGL